MTDQELFEKLKRDGEVWDDGNVVRWRKLCIKCGKTMSYNPDFSTPDGFFWLWERVWERGIFKGLLGNCEITDLRTSMSPEIAVPILFKHLIHLTRFTEALKQHLSSK